MEGFHPIFADCSGTYLWKSISNAERTTRPERKEKQYRSLLATVLGSGKEVPSSIL